MLVGPLVMLPRWVLEVDGESPRPFSLALTGLLEKCSRGRDSGPDHPSPKRPNKLPSCELRPPPPRSARVQCRLLQEPFKCPSKSDPREMH